MWHTNSLYVSFFSFFFSDNKIAQMVLSKQLALFGLVISCANDGADALTLFKSHPRGYYTMGFFDHHMPNCKCFIFNLKLFSFISISLPAPPWTNQNINFLTHAHKTIGDGVQATQQIRLLEREHAAEVKGPVPRLPIVA